MESKTKETADLKSSYQTLPADVFGLILQNVPVKQIEESLQKNEIKLTNKQFLNLLKRNQTYRLFIRPGDHGYSGGFVNPDQDELADYKEQFYGIQYYPLIFQIFKGDEEKPVLDLQNTVFHFVEGYNNYLLMNGDLAEWSGLITGLKENKSAGLLGQRNWADTNEDYNSVVYYNSKSNVFTLSENGNARHRNDVAFKIRLNQESRLQFAQELEKMLESLKFLLQQDGDYGSVEIKGGPERKIDIEKVDEEISKIAPLAGIGQGVDDYEIAFNNVYDAVLVQSRLSNLNFSWDLGITSTNLIIIKEN